MKFLRLAIIASLALAAASCCSCRKGKTNAQANKPLVGTEWKLAQLNGQGVTAGENSFTLMFDDEGRFSGRGDCNSYFGAYTVTADGKISTGNMGSTRALCPGVDKENEYYKVLDEADSYRIDGSSLMLLKNGELVAVFAAK